MRTVGDAGLALASGRALRIREEFVHPSVRALPGRLSDLSVSHSRSVVYGDLYGRAGHLIAKNGGFRPGQVAAPTVKLLLEFGADPDQVPPSCNYAPRVLPCRPPTTLHRRRE